MTYDEEAKDMTSEAAYIPKKEDFVPAPASMRKAVSAEAVRGVKYETLKRFIANKSGVAGVIILMILMRGLPNPRVISLCLPRLTATPATRYIFRNWTKDTAPLFRKAPPTPSW